jgi:16S rRNA (cytidine1402-2'-O)-methyltransferase
MGLPVIPLPGPCAAVAALSASGLATDRFLFEGFLPSRASAREERLRALQRETATLVFYEAPHRVLDCLGSLVTCLGGEREAVLARELSKAFETVRRASLSALAEQVGADPNQQRGEIVLLVEGHSGDSDGIDADSERLLIRLAEELPARRAAALVAEHTGLRRNALYQRLLDLKNP